MQHFAHQFKMDTFDANEMRSIATSHASIFFLLSPPTQWFLRTSERRKHRFYVINKSSTRKADHQVMCVSDRW